MSRRAKTRPSRLTARWSERDGDVVVYGDTSATEDAQVLATHISVLLDAMAWRGYDMKTFKLRIELSEPGQAAGET